MKSIKTQSYFDLNMRKIQEIDVFPISGGVHQKLIKFYDADKKIFLIIYVFTHVLYGEYKRKAKWFSASINEAFAYNNIIKWTK